MPEPASTTLSAALPSSMRTALDLGNHANKLARSLHSGSVASVLREAIISQAFPAGTPLVERTLAEQLGISRGPVRNALYTLEGEGLVTTASNGRAFVTGFTNDDLRDLLAVRFQLESTAVRWGLERSADVSPVLALLAEMKHEATSSQRLVDLDISFHLALLELSGSRFLVQSWQAIAPVIHTVITLGNRTLESRDPASNFNRIITSHRRIVAPMKTGNVDETVSRLADQFKFTGSMFEPPSVPPAERRTR